MLALPAPPPERSPDDFYGDSAARVDEFIGVWSRDLPPDLREINEKICSTATHTFKHRSGDLTPPVRTPKLKVALLRPS